MALVTRNFTLNVTPGAMPVTVHVSEYDIGRTYTVQLLGENGSAYEIPTGTTATIEGTLNGTVGFSTSATISNNQISFALSESMTAYAGKAWCKIKLTLNDEPIQTCAFILAVDRAGVEAETVIGASGFEQQIIDAVNNWLNLHPPSGGGMTEAFKQALLDCFENVAWINDQGQTYYDALYAALYPPADVLSISAAFTQGDAVVYNTDSLDTLKQYLVVTATMTDSTTRTVTNYTLSGTLTVGTSTITVSYGGKTATFNVTVTQKPNYNLDALDGVQWIDDYKYNTSTGVLEPFTGEHVTEKFTAQDCLYTYQAGSADRYVGVYVWNANGAFLRYDESSGNTPNHGECYQFKPGYQYAMKVFNESSFDSSAVTMMPVNNSLSGVQQFSMRLKDFKDSFTKTNSGIEFDATSIFNGNSVYTPLNEINRISEPGGLQLTRYVLDVLTVSVYTNPNNAIALILNAPSVSTVEQMQAYVEANDPTVIFNY